MYSLSHSAAKVTALLSGPRGAAGPFRRFCAFSRRKAFSLFCNLFQQFVKFTMLFSYKA